MLPWLCPGCSTQAVGLAGLLPSCPASVCPPQGTMDPMGTLTLSAHHRASSAQGAEQDWQLPGLLETNPRADLSPGLARRRPPGPECKAARSKQGHQPQQGQAGHEGCSHEQAAAAPPEGHSIAPSARATASIHLWCFLGCRVLITLAIPPH